MAPSDDRVAPIAGGTAAKWERQTVRQTDRNRASVESPLAIRANARETQAPDWEAAQGAGWSRRARARRGRRATPRKSGPFTTTSSRQW